jgi:hypothetical protein
MTTTDKVHAKSYPPFEGLFAEGLTGAPRDVRFAAYALVGLTARLQAGEPLTTLDRLLLDALRSPRDRGGMAEQALASLAMSFYARPNWADIEDVAAGLPPDVFAAPPHASPFAARVPVRFRFPVSAEMAGAMTRRSKLNAALDAAFSDVPAPLAPPGDKRLPRGVERGGDAADEAPVETPPSYSEQDGEGDDKYGISLHAITALEESSGLFMDDTIRWTFDGVVTYTDKRTNFVKLISREHEDLQDIRQISDLGDYSYDDPADHSADSNEMRLANVIAVPGGNVVTYGWFRLDDFVSLQGAFRILETSGADLKDIIEKVFKALQVAVDLAAAAPVVQGLLSGGAALVLGQLKQNQALVALGGIISGLIDESKTLFAKQVRIDRADVQRAFQLAPVQLPEDPERDDKRIFRAADVAADTVFPPGTSADVVAASVKVVDAGLYNALGIGNPIEYRVTWLARDRREGADYLTAIRYERVRRAAANANPQG